MDYCLQRERMVEGQLSARGIKNGKVLATMRKVERQLFVPDNNRQRSYDDCPLSIGEGQTISQPYIVALMTEALSLTGDERVLEIGTGSGYQTAILAEIAREVYTIETISVLAERAQALFIQLGYVNIRSKIDDGTLGWPESAPFDRIIVTAASPVIPQPFIEQLNDAGTLIIPVGDQFSQMLILVVKNHGEIHTTEICGVRFVPLLGRYAWVK